jgi:hypothetical protein
MRFIIPALFTKISTGPTSSSIFEMPLSTASSSVTLKFSVKTSSPAFAYSTLHSASFSSEISFTHIFAPAAPSTLAMAIPIPCVPPVIKATLPERLKSSFIIFLRFLVLSIKYQESNYS